MTNRGRPPIQITGLGLAVPEHSLDQDQAVRLSVDIAGLSADSERLATTLHRRSGIDRRGCVVLDSTAPDGLPCDQRFYLPGTTSGPTTAARMAMFASHAAPLGATAAANALADARRDPTEITHLITVSCTGFAAPGPDLGLIRLLGLRPSVQRVHVGFMGCHGAINALSIARALAESGARVLVVCIELCTLHLHASDRADRLVANALFADGAAACVVEPTASNVGRVKATILGSASTVFPNSEDAMAWSIGDHGFEMSLAESVPALIRSSLNAWLGEAVAHALPNLPATGFHWCIHPGGPKVLDAVRDAIGLPESALVHSRVVLREHGNMSSATVLFILDRLRSSGASGPAAMLAFGPGLCAEACFVQIES